MKEARAARRPRSFARGGFFPHPLPDPVPHLEVLGRVARVLADGDGGVRARAADGCALRGQVREVPAQQHLAGGKGTASEARAWGMMRDRRAPGKWGRHLRVLVGEEEAERAADFLHAGRQRFLMTSEGGLGEEGRVVNEGRCSKSNTMMAACAHVAEQRSNGRPRTRDRHGARHCKLPSSLFLPW